MLGYAKPILPGCYKEKVRLEFGHYFHARRPELLSYCMITNTCNLCIYIYIYISLPHLTSKGEGKVYNAIIALLSVLRNALTRNNEKWR